MKQYDDEKALCEAVRSHYNILINTLCTLSLYCYMLIFLPFFLFFFPFPLKKPKPTDGYEDPNPRLLTGRWEMEMVALGGFQQSWAQRHLRHLPAQKRWMAEPHGWPSPPRHVFSLSDSSWQVPMALCALWGKAINPGFVFQPTAIASR